MTTKHKIIAGFSLMVILLGSIAYLGYSDIQKVSDGFNTYRRLARLNVSSSALDTLMNSAGYEIFHFIDTRNPKNMENARKAVSDAAAQIKASKELAHLPESLAMIGELESSIQPFLAYIDTIQTGTLSAREHYEKTLQPNAAIMTKSLNHMAEQAKAVNNLEALSVMTDIWEEFAAARSALGQFAESRMQKDADIARAHLKTAEGHLQTLGADLHTAEGKKVHAEVMQAFLKLNEVFNAMEAQYKTLATALKGINETLQAMLSTSHKFSSSVNDQMNLSGPAMLASNKAAQERMLLVGAVGLLLGVAFAIFIIYGIIRVLNAVSAFALAVSRGDFDQSINVQEKGEIGTMIAAMQSIPAVLEKLQQDVAELTDGVLAGRFRDRLDSSHFDGSFAALTKALNAVNDAYTSVLDALPVPIMACNQKNTIQFLNAIAQEKLGGDFQHAQCDEHIKADVCKSNNCFGACAMQKNAPHTAETRIYPQGKRMDVTITATPLRDMHQNPIGYIESITDLTEIKDKQTTMLNVARDASEMSSRVAAASEELAAQVEQISRGSEIQRTRVESTASAMTQMNSTVMEVARNAGRASEQSEDTRKKAEEGASLVNQVVDSITTINTVAQTLQTNMQELGTQAESIGGVMNVISDIADQTNLLALNAAIEAARAGEAGRGFAVVADEVRKLAEKTMTATQEVGSSINAIQHSARANIGEVSNAVSSINDATGLAHSSGQALEEIVNLATANSSVVTSIATAAEEQSATSEEINRAIDEINQVIGETTEGLVQSSAAVMDLAKTAQELRVVMEGLK